MSGLEARNMRLMATGLVWLVLAAYLLGAGIPEWASEPHEPVLLAPPAFGLASLFAAFGLFAAKPFARGIVALVAGLGLLGALVGLFSFSRLGLAAVWPFQALLALGTLFFAWSIVLVVWLWPARPLSRPAAG